MIFKMKRCKGSITVFSLLSILLVTATLFALLEGARLQELNRLSLLQTDMALESCFANYNVCLWQEYHLLGSDQNQAEDILLQTANGRNDGAQNLLNAYVKSHRIESPPLPSLAARMLS